MESDPIGLSLKPKIPNKITVFSTFRAHIICREAVIGITQCNTDHDALVVRDFGMLTHHVRLHNALAVDNANQWGQTRLKLA